MSRGIYEQKNDKPLLSACTRTLSTELLGLHPTGVGNQQCPVVGDKLLLELKGRGSIEVFCVVSNDSLGDSLTNCVDLRNVSSSLYTNTDVNRSEGLFTNDKNSLIDLKSEDLWLKEVDRGAVDFDKTLALTSVSYSSSGLNNKKI